jgi:ligand-binding sensor domain-containing protein
MSLLPNGEIWIGSMEGLLHFNKGQMEFVSDTKILPLQARILEWRVLAGTPAGDIWVSDQQNNVCRLNQGWKCFQPIQEDPADTVLSAAFVGENHLWFGSRSGRFLEYNQGTWKTYQISRLFQQPYKTQKIGSMAYDPKSGMLWALETSMPQKEPGTGAVPGIGLITRTKDGKWNLLEKSFFDRFKDNNFNGVLKTIAVDQNSHAWIGMIDRYGVVEYDGSGWKTMAGEKLPIKPAFFQYEEERHHQDTKCQLLQDDYIIDLDTPAQGGLLVLNNLGVFQYQGLPK